RIGLAAHNYHDTNGGLPPATDQSSWRVYLLPYIEEDRIYKQYNLNEPWDSASNKRFASERIPTYISPAERGNTVETRYRVFVGPGALYEPGKRRVHLADITDGTANTIFAVEARETVPWPQPKELDFDRDGRLPELGFPSQNGFNAVMVDGSVRFIRN